MTLHPTSISPAVATGPRPVRQMRTPYHTLSESQSAAVPAWAGRRQVIRRGDRTIYLVDTSDLDSARTDLTRLSQAGWDVTINRSGRASRVALSQNTASVAPPCAA